MEITVVIPVYNGSRHLDEAVGSVLRQTIGPVHLVIVDDGSTDDTPHVAAKYSSRATCLRIEHGGAAQARNAGVRLVRSEFLAFLDADDVWEADKLECQIQPLVQDRGLDLVFGLHRQFPSPELTPAEQSALVFDPRPGPAICASTLLMRTAGFHRVGEFRAELMTGEFIEWYARARDLGLREVMVQRLVSHRRLHRGNCGIRNRHLRSDYVRSLKAVLDRRRNES